MLKIYATGRHFRESSDLKSVIDLLGNYEVAFDRCLKISCEKFEVRPVNAHLRLRSAEPGSLNVQIITDIASAIAPLAPQLFGHAWTLYKAGYDLTMIATRFFKERGVPVTINTVNINNPVVNVVQGDQINTSPEVLGVALKIHPYLDKIAKMIGFGFAEQITLRSDDSVEELDFNKQNKNSFHVQEMDATESETIDFECGIYRLNRRSNNGYLEFYAENQTQSKPFTVEPGLLDACIDALRSKRTRVTAYREMTTNALGETKIKKFHIIAIENIT